VWTTASTACKLEEIQKGELQMFKTLLHVAVIIVIGFISGAIGMLIGALIGGNFAEQFVFNGVQGYEATSQVGLILGALIGLISGWLLLFKRKSTSVPG
jgi:LPXTG-motif cell wall-anchored protein